MKIITLTLFLLLALQDSLTGIWLYKEDSSRFEIYQKDGKLFGRLLSSKNADLKIGLEVLKDIKLVDGQWQGKFYLIKKEQWIDAILEPRGDLLLFEINYGFMAKKFHWYREKKN